MTTQTRSARQRRIAFRHILFLILSLFIATGGVYAQGTSFKYNFVKGYLIGEGYKICEDKYCLSAQGESCNIYRTFYPNTTYKIVAFSDDEDVTDMDVALYYSNGSVYAKDVDGSAMAAIVIAPYTSTYLEAVWKNYASNTPRYKSNVYLIIGYK